MTNSGRVTSSKEATNNEYLDVARLSEFFVELLDRLLVMLELLLQNVHLPENVETINHLLPNVDRHRSQAGQMRPERSRLHSRDRDFQQDGIAPQKLCVHVFVLHPSLRLIFAVGRTIQTHSSHAKHATRWQCSEADSSQETLSLVETGLESARVPYPLTQALGDIGVRFVGAGTLHGARAFLRHAHYHLCRAKGKCVCNKALFDQADRQES